MLPEVEGNMVPARLILHHWRKRYGGVQTDAIKPLRELEKKNARLTKVGRLSF
jgi:hypothetical protein